MRVPGREEFNTTVDGMLIRYWTGLPKRVKEKEELKEVDSKCVLDCVDLNTYMEIAIILIQPLHIIVSM